MDLADTHNTYTVYSSPPDIFQGIVDGRSFSDGEIRDLTTAHFGHTVGRRQIIYDQDRALNEEMQREVVHRVEEVHLAVEKVRAQIHGCLTEQGVHVVRLVQDVGALWGDPRAPRWRPRVDDPLMGYKIKDSFPGLLSIFRPFNHPNLAQEVVFNAEPNKRVSIAPYKPHLTTLQKICSSEMTEKKWQNICIGGLRGNYYLHTLRFIHGDIKPDNISIVEYGGEPSGILSDLESVMPFGSELSTVPYTQSYAEISYYGKKPKSWARNPSRDVFSWGITLIDSLGHHGLIEREFDTKFVMDECKNSIDVRVHQESLFREVESVLAGSPLRPRLEPLLKKMLGINAEKRPSFPEIISVISRLFA